MVGQEGTVLTVIQVEMAKLGAKLDSTSYELRTLRSALEGVVSKREHDDAFDNLKERISKVEEFKEKFLYWCAATFAAAVLVAVGFSKVVH